MDKQKKSKNTDVTISCTIGKDSVIDGNLNAQEGTRIDGTVHGNVTGKQVLIIGNGGTVEGNVSSENLIVGGTIKGDIKVTGRIEVTESAVIHGNIVTNVLIMDENAIFEGNCKMVRP